MTYHSLQLWGLVANQKVKVLIDTEASYNFICPKLAQEVGLVVCPTSNFVVKVGNGDQITSTRRSH